MFSRTNVLIRLKLFSIGEWERMETTFNRTGLDTLEDIMYEADISGSQVGFRMSRSETICLYLGIGRLSSTNPDPRTNLDPSKNLKGSEFSFDAS